MFLYNDLAIYKPKLITILEFAVGDLVMLKVPDVDRGPLCCTNLLCFIMEQKNGLFQLASRAGILSGYLAANAFERTTLQVDFFVQDLRHIRLA